MVDKKDGDTMAHARLSKIEERLTEHDIGLERVDQRQEDHERHDDQRFTSLEKKIDSLDGKIDALPQKIVSLLSVKR